MRNFLSNLKTLSVELIGLIGGFIWAINSNWDYEPIILLSISGIGLFVSILLRLMPSDENIPRIQLELLYTGGSRSNPRLTINSPKTEEGHYLIEKGGNYVFEIIWKYELIIRNNSIHNAYDVKVKLNKKHIDKFNFINKHNSLEPIQINKSIILKLEYSVLREMDHYEAEKLVSEKYPQEIRDVDFLIEYKNENREKLIHTIFILPKFNKILSNKESKKRIDNYIVI